MSTATAKNSGFPLIYSFASEEIGADAAVYCALQDSNGVLYFGGNALIVYDGDRWTSTTAPGLRSIYGLDFSEDGKIWAAAEGEMGWFERNSDSQWNYHSLLGKLSAENLPHGQVFQVLSTGTGAVFFSPDKVYRWDGHKFEIWTMPGVRRVTGFRINGEIYVHYRLKGLFKLLQSGPELCIPQSLIGDTDRGAVLWIDPQPDRWLFATGSGVFEYANGRTRPLAPEVSRILYDAIITSGIRLPDGRFAFGTIRQGVVLMRQDGTLDSILNEGTGFPATYVTSLFLDRENSLWVTSPSRAIRMNLGQSSRTFDERAHLSPQVYRAITRAQGQLTVANTVSVYALNNESQNFAELTKVGGNMHTITTSPEGLIVAGYRGAWRLKDGVVSAVSTSIQDVQAAIPSRLYPGEIFLSQDPNPAIIAVSNTNRVRTLVDQLPVAVTSLAEDSRGRLWMATETKGVFVAEIRPSSTVHAESVAEKFHLPLRNEETYVRSTQKGEIVIFASTKGWIKSTDDVFTPIQNYPDRPIVAASDFLRDGTAWVVHTSSGSSAPSVAQISVQDGRAIWTPHSVLGLETIGMPTSIFAEQDDSGLPVLWIGGTRSILRHVVENGPAAPRPKTPILRAYFKNGSTGTKRPISSVLPYSTGSIEFEFAEPEFALRPQLRLQTKIAGIDTEWIPGSRDSRRELTAIREGKYTFSVRAVAETGAASEPTVFSFEVAPPWWRTPTAAIAGILILIPVGYGMYRWRVQTLRQRNTELEQKVHERTEELAEASAAKTMFVANMSHDIRNPLNGIVGLALALEDTKLDSKQREIIATLRECTTYLSSLVDDVLDFASIEAGKIELRPGPFVPSDLLNSIVTTLKAEAAQRGALITIETDPDVPRMLRGDAGRIQQILVNYLSNALKYAGGHVRLAVSVAANSPGEVEFSVADEGAGISEDEQKTLFTKFARLEGARRDNIKGTGLGLAACRLLADAMGGSVGVESNPGRGSRFLLRLPLTIAAEPARVSDDTFLPRTSVLLVEDTDYNAMAASAVLAKLGLTCDRARTGEEAIQMFALKRHNVVLLDRNLPDMDGTEVARKMRELETDGLQSVLLAVTAYCTEEDRALCLKAGMDAFVGKPLTPEKLRRVLLDASRRILGAATIEAPVETRPKQPTPEIDTTLLEYLADDATGGVAAQTTRFITALNEAFGQLVALQSTDDLNALGDAAHKVLGHGRMVGAEALTEACAALETAARNSDTDGIARAFPRVANEVTKLTEALRRRSGAQKV
jgi:signal transduction histidine kinase/CheY-like chemotaxis protein